MMLAHTVSWNHLAGPSGLLRRAFLGSFDGRRGVPLKAWYVPIIAVAVQVLLIRLHAAAVPEVYLRAGMILSFLALLAFAGLNLRLTGIRIIAIGVLLNFAVIAANGGLMPVSPETADRVSAGGQIQEVSLGSPVPNSKDILLEREDTRLWWLSDTLTLPRAGIAFSVGDVVILLGLAYLGVSGAGYALRKGFETRGSSATPS